MNEKQSSSPDNEAKKSIPVNLMPSPQDVAPSARRVMRLANKVAIATMNGEGGGPFLSLTGVATVMDGIPILLLSDLSRHTQNIAKDPRASLLFDGTGDHANPLTEERVSLMGQIRKTTRADAGPRFLARHPKAFYAEFSDFSFYEMQIEDAHFVGGFGTALSLPPKVLLLPKEMLVDVLDVEAGILQHMNEDHPESVTNMAVHLLGGEARALEIDGN